MPGVSEEQVTRAREIDLLSYLRAYEPGELKPDGPGRYTTVTHGSLVISNGKWNWNAGGVAGVSALDYLIKIRGIPSAQNCALPPCGKAGAADPKTHH